MPSAANFVGSGFFVAGASQFTPGTVRVQYSSTPKASNPMAGTDALNPTNYVLSGPGPYSIVTVNPVSGDPLSIDIVLASPLGVGTWTVQVSNVQNPANTPLSAPTAAVFQVTSTAAVTPLSAGAENDDAEKIIRKHLSQALKGDNWDALIKAFSVGDDRNWDNARAAFDQLFVSSASGSWLETRASDRGITKPSNVGINDELFRKLVVKTSTNKVVHEAIREILEVFYGQDSLRAYIESEMDENYNLSGDVTLSWILDEKEEFTHTFKTAQFSSVTAAKAVEVAFALTKTMRDLGSDGFAVAFQSPTTGKNRVRIYSGSLGLGSFVRCVGGEAQNIFKFPTEVDTYSGTITTGTGYTWVYSQPDQNTTRVSLTINTGSSSVLVDLSPLREGDYVIIGQDAQIGITGTFTVKAVSISWSGALLTQTFDIDRITFNTSAVQASNNAYRFYRPTKSSIAAAGGRTVVVAQTKPGQVDISIPATTQAVNRGPRTAAYGRVNDELDIVRIQRLPSGTATITTADAHNLAVGQQIVLDNVVSATSRPFITPGNGATFPTAYTYPASHVSITAETQKPSSQTTENGTATVLSNGQILFAGGYRFLNGAYDGAKVACNRYVVGSTASIIDGTEADGATRHSHTWVATSDLNNTRQYHAASRYGTGAIVSGGLRITPYTILNGTEQYLLDGLWVNLPNMALQRSGHQQIELANGNVMVMGGAYTEGTCTNATEIFNGTSWVAGPAMLNPRTDFQAVRLSDGRILAIGGRTMGRGHDSDTNTLALWRMDETSGTAIADATGNYPLTAVGAPIITTQGKINNCRDFNTANSHLNGAGNAGAVTALLGEWTLECWFKRTTNAAAQFATYGGGSETAPDNVLMNAGIDSTGRVFWKWENGAGVDVTATMTLPLTSLPAYRVGFFNHLAVRKSLNGLAYTGKTLGWAVGDLIHGVTSGARARIVSVDGGTPGGASGTIRVTSVNHLSFASGENLVIIPTTNLAYNPSIPTAAVAGASVYDVTVFINGVPYQTWTGQTNASGGGSAQWYVARNPEVVGSGFQGFLDDVRVSKVARTDYDILANFLRGWGNHQSPSGEIAIGAVTNECEIYDGVSWTRTGAMSQARCMFQATVLPGDYVLVTGGLGYDTSAIGALNDVAVGIWPSNSLRTAEIWHPATGRWEKIQQSGVRRHNHVASLIGTTEVRLVGGQSQVQSGPADDPSYIETLDLTTKTWKTAPATLMMSGFKTFGATTSGHTVIMGGNTGLTTHPRAQSFIPAGNQISSGGLNGQHRVTAIPTPTTFQIQTTKVTEQQAYTSTISSSYQGQAYGGRFWTINTATRSLGIVNLTFTTNHDLDVGDVVYVNTAATLFPPGYKTITVVTANSISYTESGTSVLVATPIIGTVSENQIGFWTIAAGSRTSNLTTLTLNFPTTAITAHSIQIGDLVYVNSRTNAFGAGLKTITAVTDTTISYVETASNQAQIAVVGSVSENYSPETVATAVTASAQDPNDPGPYIFDTTDGVSVTSIESVTTGFNLYANQQYEEVELANGDSFPDGEGYIVFGFGTEKQSKTLKYLGKYKSGPTTTRLILDYTFKFDQDYPIGSKVTLLSQKDPFIPADPLIGGAWITASGAGRLAAEAAAEAALAAGVNPEISVVYPGDRGLGGEGLPTSGVQKLSDAVAVFAGDDIADDVESAREE